jgi:endonuclease YncB( thermonuclease family)
MAKRKRRQVIVSGDMSRVPKRGGGSMSAFVSLDRMDVGKRMIRAGFARVRGTDRLAGRRARYVAAQRVAKRHRLGLWRLCR